MTPLRLVVDDDRDAGVELTPQSRALLVGEQSARLAAALAAIEAASLDVELADRDTLERLGELLDDARGAVSILWHLVYVDDSA